MQKTVQLDEIAWGQIADGLTCRAEQYELTAQYHESGRADAEILEVRDADEARALAGRYRKIVDGIQIQINSAGGGDTDKPLWSELPYGNYMETVDYALDLMIGRDSTQEELEFIANMQDRNSDPLETALAIVRGERCCCGACPRLTCPDKNGEAGAASILPSSQN